MLWCAFGLMYDKMLNGNVKKAVEEEEVVV